jgi:hypothetical protein
MIISRHRPRPAAPARDRSAPAVACGALLAFVIACGCAQNSTSESPRLREAAPESVERAPRSGFLKDYSRLKPSPTHPTALFEQSDQLAAYRSFIIDPVEVLCDRTGRGEPLDADARRALADAARAEAIDALGITSTIVEKPGPGVARIRSAIVAVASSRRSDTGQDQIGGAAVEMEIVDSLTGQRLGAAVENDVVRVRETGDDAAGRFTDARLVFRHWAARLNQWIMRAREGG